MYPGQLSDGRGWSAFRETAAAITVALIIGTAPVGAQNAREPGSEGDRFDVPRATSEITIDGVIDEAAWDKSLKLELNYEVRPGENIKPQVETRVFITYDTTHLLVAFRAFDPAPDKIRARYRDRDNMHGDDSVGITIDTFNDQRRAYEFMVNPLGVQTDGIYSEGGREFGKGFDRSWDAIWTSEGRITEDGYEVEIAIPFNQIRFQATPGPQIWGLDCTRSYPRNNRYQIGLFPRDRGANSYLAQEEKIIGFENVSRGRNIEFVPSLVGYALEERPDFPDSLEIEEDKSFELGATALWGITPNLTLSAALNPDFSQIEADAVQLALNQRFALFFQEKRPFFLESSDYFETGLNLLYTRVITDPQVALKLTGKMGRHTVGVFSARDEITNLVVPGVLGSDSGTFETPNTSTVGRYRYDLRSNSTLGAMFTDREGSDGYTNRVASFDAQLRPTDSDEVKVNAVWSKTKYSPEMQTELDLTSDEISDNYLKLFYTHSKREWWVFGEYLDIGDDFRADLGFIPWVGYRSATAGGAYTWWGEAKNWYNRLEVGGWISTTDDQGGDLLGTENRVWLSGEGPQQSNFRIAVKDLSEVYEGVQFDGLLVPSFFLRIRPTASFAIRVSGVVGDWIDYTHVQPADRVRVSGELDFNIGRHLAWEISHLYSTLEVEGGTLYEANVPQSTLVWQFNNRTFVRAIVQYTDIQRNQDLYEDEVDELSSDFYVQLLFSYKVNPRTVFFAGYSEGGAENQDISMISTSRSVFLKIGYAWLW